MVAGGYTEYGTIKTKLRVGDDSLKDEIQLYMHEIDDLVTNRIRNKIGEFNIYGKEIIYPLAYNTVPPVDQELKAIANDLVVAKIRMINAEKPLLWDSAVKVLDDYLEKRFGWTRHKPFTPERTLTISPATGMPTTIVTLGGTNWEPDVELKITFGTLTPTTTPTDVVTDGDGVFSGVTFTVPAGQPVGSYDIKIVDSLGGMIGKFTVTT